MTGPSRPLISCFFLVAAFAYNPPVDTAGPLTVAMQPPASGSYGAGGLVDLSKPGLRLVVPVTLQNASDRTLTGTLRVQVIDRWTAEPAGEQPFMVPPRGRLRREFVLSFGPGTHNAHYPVHAYATFQDEGQTLTAHPVLLLHPRIPDLPRPALPTKWEPVAVPPGGTLGLWRCPVRREFASLEQGLAFAGLQGREIFDASSVVQYGVLPGGTERREGISVTLGPRPPSGRESIALAAVEYPLSLPAGQPAQLEFTPRGAATFRVVAAPFQGGATRTLHEGLEGAPVRLDLSAFAGQPLVLRLEASGAAGEAQWVEPAVSAGRVESPPRFPPRDGGKVIGKAAGCTIRHWAGRRGLLDAPISFECGNRRLFLRGFQVRVAGDQLEDARASTELVETREEAAEGRLRVRHRFRNWAGNFDVLTEIWVAAEALRARFWLENAPAPQPWFQVYLEGVAAGMWSERVSRVYAGPGNVIVNPRAFRLGFDGHNLATSFVGFDFSGGQAMVQHSDGIPDRLEVDPEARISTLVTPHAHTLEFFPAENVFEAVKTLRRQDKRRPSPGVAKIAGRFTFDLWSGRYAESALDLERAAKYGVRDALVVWHRWQRWGYDYRLPDIYPPNPEFGTLEEFRQLVETCRRAGTYFAPHDNYIDFYPDFEGFTYGSIVFRQNGTPYRAWFNYGREAQSYRARPDRLMPYLKRNVQLMKEGFGPTAFFIDVWSSIAPYDYWTEDGRFVERSVTQKVWGEAFAWIREHLGSDAPQLSEAGHDKLIGWLDGADPQQLRVDAKGTGFTWRVECDDAERIPWIDVAWHDKFILHGAGYEGRYQGGLDAARHGAYSDDYLSTVVLSGRPTMVPQAFSRDVVRVYWLLDEAMKALALDRISGVEFADGDIHRQHVKWERGGEVWVNRGAVPWRVAGRTLPQYGFYVRAGDCEAGVETRDGVRVEWSRSPAYRFEDGKRILPDGAVTELPAP